MKRWVWLSGFLLALLLLALAGGVYAAIDATTLTRDVFGSAGQDVTAGDIVLTGTLGEAVAGPMAASGDVQVGSGFWQRIPMGMDLYLPQIQK